jgi:hypothetical protein
VGIWWRVHIGSRGFQPWGRRSQCTLVSNEVALEYLRVTARVCLVQALEQLDMIGDRGFEMFTTKGQQLKPEPLLPIVD